MQQHTKRRLQANKHSNDSKKMLYLIHIFIFVISLLFTILA